jgi:prolyl oligopeptidase
MTRLALLAVAVSACSSSQPHPEPAPPPAPVVHVPSDPVTALPPGPPPKQHEGPALAEVHVVKDTYHGVTVEDPYRWLEDESPETKAWTAEQSAYAQAQIAKLTDLSVFKAELDKVLNAPITRYGDFKVAGGKLFARRKLPNKEQAELIVLTDPDHAKTAKTVFDPITADHPRRSVDWWVPSPDGTKIAIADSDGGSEISDLHVIDLTGKELDSVPNVQRATAGGAVAWTPDNKGLYYTRYPATGEKPDAERDFWQQVYFHQLGTPVAKDRYELGKDFPKNAEIVMDSDTRGRVLASVQQGDGGSFRHYLRDANGWHQLDDWNDQIVLAVFGGTPDLWLVSRKDAPHGKLLKLAATAGGARPVTAAEATVVVPEGKDSIVTEFQSKAGVLAVGDRLYVSYQLGGPSEIRAFSVTGKPQKAPVGPNVSAASAPVAWRGDVLVQFSSYTTPTTWTRFSSKTGKLTALTDFAEAYPVDFSNIEARRESATSKDGTAVPLNIMWPKGAPQDGTVPCIVYGYGGYGINEQPSEWISFAPLLSRGFCVVDVNLRGGSEFGEDWHRNGMLLKKQNVFDDFAAALDYLVAKHYTNRQRLGIMGGSNGGLLMGAMITQHPDAMKAVVSDVGVYDMLRVETTPNGAFNVTEYGTVTDADQFKALHAYSPYHHVGKGIAYPAIFMHTGANDGRVAPWQSRKMIAALQAANSGSAPIMLSTSETAGHGIGTNQSERIDLLAAHLAFFRTQLQ